LAIALRAARSWLSRLEIEARTSASAEFDRRHRQLLDWSWMNTKRQNSYLNQSNIAARLPCAVIGQRALERIERSW